MKTDLQHPVIDAVLSTAATLLGMEVVFLGGLTEQTFTFERIWGEWPGIEAGQSRPRTDVFCHRLLAGAPASTSDAAADVAYADTPVRELYGVTSYVGVPVLDRGGHPIATLCGVDHRNVSVDPAALGVLAELAEILSAHLAGATTDGVVVRRTPAGWQVDSGPTLSGAGPREDDDNGDDRHDDLTSAMVLADLLAGDAGPGRRPPRPDGDLDELGRLKLSVVQLEHALAARVTVEQAIGVLAERQHTSSREAFERLRRVARSRGRRVHDLAQEVVASATATGAPLPPELAGPR